MKIGALQKTTLLDFPGRVSAIVFTQGCNFLCPYCHNPGLVMHGDDPLSMADVLGFLAQRKRLLEGVVITGGEPTLQEELPAFCSLVKTLGYAIKLDTNGSRPDMLRRLLAMNLLDYVAMDIKADPRAYPKSIAPGRLGDALLQSLSLLREHEVAHEFRIPCVAPFISPASLPGIAEVLGKDGAPVFLQEVRTENVLEPDFFTGKGRALERGEIEELKDWMDSRGYSCTIR